MSSVLQGILFDGTNVLSNVHATWSLGISKGTTRHVRHTNFGSIQDDDEFPTDEEFDREGDPSIDADKIVPGKTLPAMNSTSAATPAAAATSADRWFSETPSPEAIPADESAAATPVDESSANSLGKKSGDTPSTTPAEAATRSSTSTETVVARDTNTTLDTTTEDSRAPDDTAADTTPAEPKRKSENVASATNESEATVSTTDEENEPEHTEPSSWAYISGSSGDFYLKEENPLDLMDNSWDQVSDTIEKSRKWVDDKVVQPWNEYWEEHEFLPLKKGHSLDNLRTFSRSFMNDVQNKFEETKGEVRKRYEDIVAQSLDEKAFDHRRADKESFDLKRDIIYRNHPDSDERLCVAESSEDFKWEHGPHLAQTCILRGNVCSESGDDTYGTTFDLGKKKPVGCWYDLDKDIPRTPAQRDALYPLITSYGKEVKHILIYGVENVMLANQMLHLRPGIESIDIVDDNSELVEIFQQFGKKFFANEKIQVHENDKELLRPEKFRRRKVNKDTAREFKEYDMVYSQLEHNFLSDMKHKTMNRSPTFVLTTKRGSSKDEEGIRQKLLEQNRLHLLKNEDKPTKDSTRIHIASNRHTGKFEFGADQKDFLEILPRLHQMRVSIHDVVMPVEAKQYGGVDGASNAEGENAAFDAASAGNRAGPDGGANAVESGQEGGATQNWSKDFRPEMLYAGFMKNMQRSVVDTFRNSKYSPWGQADTEKAQELISKQNAGVAGENEELKEANENTANGVGNAEAKAATVSIKDPSVRSSWVATVRRDSCLPSQDELRLSQERLPVQLSIYAQYF